MVDSTSSALMSFNISCISVLSSTNSIVSSFLADHFAFNTSVDSSFFCESSFASNPHLHRHRSLMNRSSFRSLPLAKFLFRFLVFHNLSLIFQWNKFFSQYVHAFNTNNMKIQIEEIKSAIK